MQKSGGSFQNEEIDMSVVENHVENADLNFFPLPAYFRNYVLQEDTSKRARWYRIFITLTMVALQLTGVGLAILGAYHLTLEAAEIKTHGILLRDSKAYTMEYGKWGWMFLAIGYTITAVRHLASTLLAILQALNQTIYLDINDKFKHLPIEFIYPEAERLETGILNATYFVADVFFAIFAYTVMLNYNYDINTINPATGCSAYMLTYAKRLSNFGYIYHSTDLIFYPFLTLLIVLLIYNFMNCSFTSWIGCLFCKLWGHEWWYSINEYQSYSQNSNSDPERYKLHGLLYLTNKHFPKYKIGLPQNENLLSTNTDIKYRSIPSVASLSIKSDLEPADSTSTTDDETPTLNKQLDIEDLLGVQVSKLIAINYIRLLYKPLMSWGEPTPKLGDYERKQENRWFVVLRHNVLGALRLHSVVYILLLLGSADLQSQSAFKYTQPNTAKSGQQYIWPAYVQTVGEHTPYHFNLSTAAQTHQESVTSGPYKNNNDRTKTILGSSGRDDVSNGPSPPTHLPTAIYAKTFPMHFNSTRHMTTTVACNVTYTVNKVPTYSATLHFPTGLSDSSDSSTYMKMAAELLFAAEIFRAISSVAYAIGLFRNEASILAMHVGRSR